MRTSISLIMICLIFSGCDRKGNSTPMFSVPDGVTYESDGDLESHVFRWGNGDDITLFMIFAHPAGLPESMVYEMANQIEKRAEPALRTIEDIESVRKTSADISAGRFNGRETDFLCTDKDGKTIHQ